MTDIKTWMLGSMFQANCYVAVNEKNEGFAVDIGGDPDIFLERLEKSGTDLKMILLTHGHFDHIRGVEKVAEKTGARVYIHSEDAEMLRNEDACLARFAGEMAFTPVKEFTEINDGDVIDFCGEPIRVIHTPGHTRGCVCYLIDDVMFSGDTLFCGSAGRTDFPGGSRKEILESLQKLAALVNEHDYRVFPGHEEPTRLSDEIKYNPFFR